MRVEITGRCVGVSPSAYVSQSDLRCSIHILEAVRLGLVPRVTRRLTGQERSMIRPGTIWVWEEGVLTGMFALHNALTDNIHRGN
jgi:hypothetical protein